MVADLFRSRAALEGEIPALRQQILQETLSCCEMTRRTAFREWPRRHPLRRPPEEIHALLQRVGLKSGPADILIDHLI
jgi:hypothetical protein